ncbi:hypothetical protein [Synechocystis sp. PCC 7509]|nr:hypothetical protein [Synechocystis sp. PCC 7509]
MLDKLSGKCDRACCKNWVGSAIALTDTRIIGRKGDRACCKNTNQSKA